MSFWLLCCENEGILTKTFRPGYSDCSAHYMGKFWSRLLRSRRKNRGLGFLEFSCLLEMKEWQGEISETEPVDRAHVNYEEAQKNSMPLIQKDCI